MGVRRGAYRILVGKPEGKGPREVRGSIILKSDFQEIGWE
jgi:hypothetical protein